LILKRRDVRVVEGARLENEAGEPHQATSKSVNAHAISDLAFSNYQAVCVRKPRCSSRFWACRITFLSQSARSLTACCVVFLSVVLPSDRRGLDSVSAVKSKRRWSKSASRPQGAPTPRSGRFAAGCSVEHPL